MSGRDPHEKNRTATTLELLFDLTFVIAFSQAGDQAAHYFELGHTFTALVGFPISVFAVTWAWINFSWLSSAYDNDDVFYRIATFIQMIGVSIVALSLPPFFESLDAGQHVDNSVMVAGYVLMRLVTVALWLRVAKHDPAGRATALTYAVGLGIVQFGWVAVIFVNPPVWLALVLMVGLVAAELVVPVVAERKRRTPWHAHHIAERYFLLIIVTLGEVILGTVTAIGAVVHEEGWSVDAVLVALAGMMLAFAMWWAYSVIPVAQILHRHRDRAFTFGYVHIPLLLSVAAVGAGFHVVAFVITGEAHVSDTYALLTVVGAVAGFAILLTVLYDLLVKQVDGAHTLLLIGTLLILTIAVVTSLAGASLVVSLLIVALAPLTAVVSGEMTGYRATQRHLTRLDA